MSLVAIISYLCLDCDVIDHIFRFHVQRYDSPIGYQGIAANAHFALRALSNYICPSIFQVFLHIPESVRNIVELSNVIYPWLRLVSLCYT